MQNKKRISISENFRYFTRYVSVFTVIFLLMTLIILNIINVSAYSEVDSRLNQLASAPERIITTASSRAVFGDDLTYEVFTERVADGSDSLINDGDHKHIAKFSYNANTSALVFDKNKKLIFEADPFLQLDQIDFDFNNLGKLSETEIVNASGDAEVFRLVVVRVPDEISESVEYAVALTNITQLKALNSNNNKIIVLIMLSFWLLSIVASYWLTIITIKPIKEMLEKQKAFVENASHELRTPLAVLQNRLESLFRKPDTTILEEFESIASSLDEVRNMRLLTSNLLNLARRDGELKVVSQVVEPEFFDTTFNNFSLIADENQKQFKSQNLVRKSIQTDSALLKQVMTIIFDNAVKYTGEDGEIKITSKIRERQLVVSVEDNGLGISDENKKKIFDRFYRVDKARTRQNGGFGLGLSLAKQIVDQLKGQILVHDRVPKGTIFELRLPI
ncbi:sensor histidine kinase [Streptococcus merionis]|uniref:sensor histidine kinase n=1 Tax=Streptococcus merionis TaxID=400065 RepID=UPI003519941B